MTMMNREQTEDAIAKAENEYQKACQTNGTLLNPMREEIKRLNAAARKAKDKKVKKLKAYLAVIDSGVTPPEDEGDAV